MDKKLLILGFGYTSSYVADLLMAEGWEVAATFRDERKREWLKSIRIHPVLFDGKHGMKDLLHEVEGVTHVLDSIPPNQGEDPAYHWLKRSLLEMQPEWFGYLSTTGVYGDHGGAWVDEHTPPHPQSLRGQVRLKIEKQWLATDLPTHIFRIAGIYGPGRSSIIRLKEQRERRIIKPGHYFSRIHVEDLARTIIASMQSPNPGQIYNVADDEPAPSAEVVEYAAEILGIHPPPAIPFEQADLPDMTQSFYQDNKRVRNDKMKKQLGVALQYPTYREGLSAIAGIEGKI